jgi:hypothetical protein
MTNCRKPLRRIVARTPVTHEYKPHSSYFLTYYIDTLECGHQIETYAFEAYKKRRGCGECSEAQLMPEFSLVSFPSSEKKAA